MSATPNPPETGTSKRDAVSSTVQKRAEVHPNVSFWDIREVRESQWLQRFRALAQSVVIPGIVTVLFLIARMLWFADGVQELTRFAGVVIVALLLVILGLAVLFTGAKNHATNSEKQSDQSLDSGDGGDGS